MIEVCPLCVLRTIKCYTMYQGYTCAYFTCIDGTLSTIESHCNARFERFCICLLILREHNTASACNTTDCSRESDTEEYSAFTVHCTVQCIKRIVQCSISLLVQCMTVQYSGVHQMCMQSNTFNVHCIKGALQCGEFHLQCSALKVHSSAFGEFYLQFSAKL